MSVSRGQFRKPSLAATGGLSTIGSRNLNNMDLEDDIFEPQVNYCCGNKGNIVGQEFKKARSRSTFVILVFSAKMLEMAIMSSLILVTIQWEPMFAFAREYYWIMFITLPFMLILYFCARCGGAGRKCPTNVILLTIMTLAGSYTCAGFITLSWVHPYAYIIFLYTTTIALMSFGTVIITLMFEADVTGRGIYKGLFFYFLLVIGISHVAYIGNIAPRFGISYHTFIEFVAIGGSVGFFTGLVMLWNIQELLAGKVVSISEKEYIFAALII